ncbi:MAG: flagellar biosynthetic protein FliO [Pseudomonadales bacterium]|nr:flagellar biosynthetic protein FliO [Pseudomonadales bacterium]
MNHSTRQTFLGPLKALLAVTLISVSNWSFADEASAPLDVAKEGIFTPAYLMQSFAGLVIVIGLILILAMLFRRFGDQGLGTPGNMRVIGGLNVGQRERLVLVQVGEKQILLGVAPGSVRSVMAFDEPLENTSAQPGQTGSLLNRIINPRASGDPS